MANDGNDIGHYPGDPAQLLELSDVFLAGFSTGGEVARDV